MPQTDPFHSLVPRKLTNEELARAIRLDIEAELDAINLYQSHIDATDDEEAIRVIRHVMDEEKEHAALFFELLKVLDPKQAEEAMAAEPKFRLLRAGATDEEVEAVGASPEASGEALPAPPRLGLTIGSLKG